MKQMNNTPFFATILLLSSTNLVSGPPKKETPYKTISKKKEPIQCSGILSHLLYEELQAQNALPNLESSNNDVLFAAIKDGKYTIVRDYINAKPSNIITDDQNNTLLHAAAISDDMTMVNLFLNFSAHIFEMMHHINFSLQTPFDIAQSNGSIEVLNAMKIRYDRYTSAQRMHSEGYLPPSQRPKKRKYRTKYES